MFELMLRTVLTDHTGQVVVFQGVADMVGFDSTSTSLLSGKNTVQDALTTLDTILNRKMEAKIYTATCSANYSAASNGGAPFTQNVSVPGIKATDEIGFVDVVTSTSDCVLANNQIKHFGYITRIDTADNMLQLRCDKKKPQIQLPIKILIFRKSFV